jgi:hypothetical protein
MIIPEFVYQKDKADPFRYPTELLQRRASVSVGAATTATVTVWPALPDRHLIINSLLIDWDMQPNAVTITRMGDIYVQLVDRVTAAVLTFFKYRSTNGLRPDSATTEASLAAGGGLFSASWNVLTPGTWIPAGYDVQVQVVARNAVPISNTLGVTMTGFTIPLGGIYR